MNNLGDQGRDRAERKSVIITGISVKSNLRYGKRGKGTSAFKEVNITAIAERTITFA